MTLQTDLIAHINNTLSKFDQFVTELAKTTPDLAILRSVSASGRTDIVNAKTKANTLIDLYADLMPYNVYPVATDDTIITPKNTAVTFAASVILANDSDADDTVLRVGNVLNAINGTVQLINANTIRFTPTTDFEGVASFEYRVFDPHNVHDTGLVTVLVGEQQQPEPEPEPEPEPDPTPPAFWQGLATVWPNATTTGPRIARTNWTGGSSVSGLISGKKFTSTVFPANGTVFEDCEFDINDAWGIDGDGRTFSCVNCKLVGHGGQAPILGNATVLNCDISGWLDGMKIQGSNAVIRGNYLHDPWSASGAHNDGIELYGPHNNVLVEQNYIAWRDTSEIYISGLHGNVTNVVLRHNYCGGSDHPIRVESKSGNAVTGIEVYENAIKRGYWGYNAYTLSNGGSLSVDSHDNIDAVTGVAI